MTFYAGWQGLASAFPGLSGLSQDNQAFINPPTASLDALEGAHAAEISQVLEAWATDHPDEHLSLSVSGSAIPVDTGGTRSNLSLSLTTRPATEEERNAVARGSVFAAARERAGARSD